MHYLIVTNVGVHSTLFVNFVLLIYPIYLYKQTFMFHRQPRPQCKFRFFQLFQLVFQKM